MIKISENRYQIKTHFYKNLALSTKYMFNYYPQKFALKSNIIHWLTMFEMSCPNKINFW